MKLKWGLRAGLLAAALTGASACDIPINFPSEPEGTYDPCPGSDSPAASFKLSSSSFTMRPGQTVIVGLEVKNTQGAYIGCVFPDWSVRNPEIATVGEGRITGLKDGTTVITARWTTFVDSAVVTVNTPVITAVWITLPPLLVGQTAKANMIIEATGDVNGMPVFYSSTDATKAAVSPTGMVTALQDGTVDIIAQIAGISASHRLRITRDAPQVRFSAIAAGSQHTCGLAGGGAIPEGTAFCWGSGYYGQIGNGQFDNSFTPAIVSSVGASYSSIAAGEGHSCALTAGGDAYCWGSNFVGELGDGTQEHRGTPVKVQSSVKFTDISAGLGHTCALTSDSKVYCWGRIHKMASLVPARVEGLPRIMQVTSQNLSACVLADTGEVYCWGNGDGLIVTTSYEKPTKVANGMKFKSITSGAYHTCGLKDNGAAYCWGMNATGQIDPSGASFIAQPFLVSGTYSFTSIAAGGLATCGITVSSGARCIGLTQLANTPNGRALSLLEIPREQEHPFVTLASGQFHTCAIDNRGGVWCWGEQRFGAVGAGEGQVVDQPLQVRINPG